MIKLTDLDEISITDMMNLLCGDFIGAGRSRRVYDCKLIPKHVVKIESECFLSERNQLFFDNIMEYYVYNKAKHCEDVVCGGRKIYEWLAPIKFISSNGKILIQAKTKNTITRLPDFIPEWIGDVKADNGGIYKNKFVFHDYASHKICSYGFSERTKNVDWCSYEHYNT